MVLLSILMFVFSVAEASQTDRCAFQATQLKKCTEQHKGKWGKCENACFLKKSSCLERNKENPEVRKRCFVEGKACSSQCVDLHQEQKLCPTQWESLQQCRRNNAIDRPSNVFAVSVDESVLGIDLLCNRETNRGKRVGSEFWFTNIDRTNCSQLKFKPTGTVWSGSLDMDVLYCQMKSGGSMAVCSEKNPKIKKKQTRKPVETTVTTRRRVPQNTLQISVKGLSVLGVDLICDGKNTRGRKVGSSFEFPFTTSKSCKVKFKPSGITWVGSIEAGSMSCQLNSRNLANCKQP